MKAIGRMEYGDVDQVRLLERPAPQAGPGEVQVQVRAAGVDRGVWHVMAGMPYVARPAFGLRRPSEPVLGSDVAGVVSAVGDGVTGFTVGDEVLGTTRAGSFAEVTTAPADRLVAKPGCWSFEQAAAVPISGITAWEALHDKGGVQPGQRVLVIGASGGVGSMAVALAVVAGARVDGVASAAKADLVRGLGAERVWAYDEGEAIPSDGRYDLVLDTGGHRSVRLLRRALAPRGTLVVIGSETGGRWLGGIQRAVGAALLSPVVRQRLVMLIAGESAAHLQALVEVGERHGWAPTIERTFPLSEGAEAIAHVAAGRARGKVVVTI